MLDLKKKRGVEAQPPQRVGGAGPPPFANSSNTSRSTNLFIVVVAVVEVEVVEVAVVVVVVEGTVIRTWVEPGFEPGSVNVGSNWVEPGSEPG